MISIIIPCHSKNNLCPELLPAIKKQTYKNFEILIIPDQLCPGRPAKKRDWAAKKAKGETLAFIDADAYPNKNWLKNSLVYLKKPKITAVCGPGLTPPSNNIYQKISGLVSSIKLSAGPYTYRCQPERERFVDDYPTFNFLVKKSDFNKIGGFNTKFWPGEDTKLCLDLTHKLKKQILYHPKIIVFHHRRPIFLPHLQQISRYGLQRGYFVKKFPQTSLRFSYFIPLIWLITLPMNFPLYLIILISVSLYHQSFLLLPAIFLTHLTYSIFFLKGLFLALLKLSSTTHYSD